MLPSSSTAPWSVTRAGSGPWLFTQDERHLASASADGSVRVWRVQTGYSFSMLSEKDQWVIYTDDGYFDASRYGGDMVSLVQGLRAYAVDQYALYYNRPI